MTMQWICIEPAPCEVDYDTLKAYGLTPTMPQSDLTPRDRQDNALTALVMWGAMMVITDEILTTVDKE